MTETVNVPVSRWPTVAEGGGVFTNPMQMARALVDLRELGWTGKLDTGPDLGEPGWHLPLARDGSNGVVARMGTLLVLAFDVLQVMTADQYTQTTGGAP